MMKKLVFLLPVVLVACGKASAPADPLHEAAIATCKNTIESRAVNRNSITYIANDTPVSKDAKGQLNVSIKFSAKNEIGMASTMLAQCVVSPDGKSLVDIAAKESR
jgi:hypothetical protein